MSPTRFPRWVYGGGTEPDPRFTLANERTFLAWIRTALGLIAGGVALEALGLPLQPGLRLAASVILLALGLGLPLLAWFRWGAAERAVRQGLPLPAQRILLVLAVGIVVVAVLVLLAMITA
jgi:putative membrane protein